MRQIGSDYHILKSEVERISLQSRLKDNLDGFEEGAKFLSTCRSAISWILTNEIKPRNKKVLLPGFTCHSVIEPCINAGYEVYPYSITESLCVNRKTFEEILTLLKPGVVILHGYFGFNTLKDLKIIIDKLLREGVIVIEDRTQTLFSDFSISSSYKVGSIRKWLPIPDGAYIYGTNFLRECEQDDELAKAKLCALNSKAEFLVNGVGDGSLYRRLFVEAEELLDSRHDIYKMNDVSKLIYQQTNIDSLKIKRRDNYKILFERLSQHHEIKLPLKLEAGVVPFHLPVLISDRRKELQQYLAKNGIFATIIWACPKEFCGKLDEVTQSIFDNILCFHCDQRYDADDMNRIGDVVDEFYK